jgi:hypothetical protein
MELRKLGFNVIAKKINGSTQYTYAVSFLFLSKDSRESEGY